ncbi:MAG TPA: hypothetical protein P5050_10780 [Bacteroidia bacterium]|nr:hypothetical protein [Bacteroidia bacterium]HRS59690.1 hypothetical protein [Bacteroidia bacterium]
MNWCQIKPKKFLDRDRLISVNSREDILHNNVKRLSLQYFGIQVVSLIYLVDDYKLYLIKENDVPENKLIPENLLSGN